MTTYYLSTDRMQVTINLIADLDAPPNAVVDDNGRVVAFKPRVLTYKQLRDGEPCGQSWVPEPRYASVRGVWASGGEERVQ